MNPFVRQVLQSSPPPPWQSHVQLEQLLRRRRVLAPLLRALRGMSVIAPTTFIPALTVVVATQRHPEYPDLIGKFAPRVDALCQHLQEAEWGLPFRRREVADLSAQLEGFCASTLLEDHDEALAYWSTAALRWAVRTERPMDAGLLQALTRLQGANEQVDALIAHASRDAHSWLAAMEHIGRAVHKTGPLARRLT